MKEMAATVVFLVYPATFVVKKETNVVTEAGLA
jgi:hypothetical protein